jgi:hypothetical protein
VLTPNQVLWLKFQVFTGSPIHPPLGDASSASAKEEGKMARLADLQRQIDEATEEVRHLAQDEQERRPQHRELHQEGLFDDNGWYEDFHHGNFAFDDVSPLSAELQATP